MKDDNTDPAHTNGSDGSIHDSEYPSLELIEALPVLADGLKREVGKAIVGQGAVVDEVLITLLCGGHAVLEGVPGLAKTLLVNTLAQTLSLDSGRVQFTPDLMPADITGSLVIKEDPGTGERSFVFRRGPIFVNLLLADEINRSPPKTQAALLEGMGEHRVTAAGTRYDLPQPFFVLATQNPIEREGTYPLPEAQLDRFLMKIVIDYPEFDDEEEIVRRTTGDLVPQLSAVISREELLALQRLIRCLPVSTHVAEFATRLARSSRPGDDAAAPWVDELIAWGAGPRAGQALIMAAKARTLLSGRFSVTRADVRSVAAPILRHRILPSFQADAEGESADTIVDRLIHDLSSFRRNETYDATTQKILRL